MVYVLQSVGSLKECYAVVAERAISKICYLLTFISREWLGHIHGPAKYLLSGVLVSEYYLVEVYRIYGAIARSTFCATTLSI